MSQLSKMIITVAFLYNVCMGSDITAPKLTQVIIIGTIHDKHYKNPNYSPDVLKNIILSLKPDVILNELPLSQVDPNGRPIEVLRKKNFENGPECWAIDTTAIQLGIKQIPFDRPDRQEYREKTNYFERDKRAKEMLRKWGNEITNKDSNSLEIKIVMQINYAGQAVNFLDLNAGPEIINSEGYDSITMLKLSTLYDITPFLLKKYPGYETTADDYLFEKQEWQERNKIMADNIIKAAKEYPGKRLVVITGSTHRYILRDLLKNADPIDLKEYWEIIPPTAPDTAKQAN